MIYWTLHIISLMESGRRALVHLQLYGNIERYTPFYSILIQKFNHLIGTLELF